MLLFFQGILVGLAVGVLAGVCTILYDIWDMIFGDDEDDDLKSSAGRFSRITVRPDQMGGVPCIRALRIPVATVVGLLAQGVSREDVLAEYPDLEIEDLREALLFAAAAVEERQLPLAASG